MTRPSNIHHKVVSNGNAIALMDINLVYLLLFIVLGTIGLLNVHRVFGVFEERRLIKELRTKERIIGARDAFLAFEQGRGWLVNVTGGCCLPNGVYFLPKPPSQGENIYDVTEIRGLLIEESTSGEALKYLHKYGQDFRIKKITSAHLSDPLIILPKRNSKT